VNITRRQLRALIKEAIPHIVLDDVHEVPDDLESFDPHEAYGIGHDAGMEHSEQDEDDYLSSEPPTVEDAWSGGDNLDDPLDHTYFETGERNAGPHVPIREAGQMSVTRRQLRQIIKEATVTPRMRGQHDSAAYTSGLYEAEPSAGTFDTDGDGALKPDELRDLADSLDGDSRTSAASGPRDIVHARIGEIYEEDMLEADLAIWLANNSEFSLAEPGKSYTGWWGTDVLDDASWYVDGPEEGPKETLAMSNRESTNEGTPVNEMSASWQQILRDIF
jgi:hypothetical protein